MLTLEQNIRAVIETCFSESKEELHEIATQQIIGLIESNASNTLKPLETHWIPCSERLPEHYDWYLVSNKDVSWVALWKDGVFFSVSGYFEFSDIIAWMPLPEAYKEK